MANFVFTGAKAQILGGTIDFDTNDLRAILCMTNTDAVTQQDATLVSGILLDEMDGANYARIALVNEAINTDNPNNRAEFDADNITWTALGAGTRAVAGLIIYKHVTTDADSIPIIWIDDVFPFTANGGDLTINWNAEGILQAT